MNTAEMMVHTRLAATNDRGYNFTVPAAPKSRQRKRLSDVLRHAKSIPQNAHTNVAATDTADPPPDVLPPLPSIAIPRYTHAPSSERGVAAPANVAAVIGGHDNMFDLNSHEGRQREYIKHTWAYAIACGAIVEPPASNVPEIIVSPDTKASSIPMPKSYYDAITGPYRRY